MTNPPNDPPPNPDEWHPQTRKDYEDIMAGGIIRARELEEAEKAKNQPDPPDDPPKSKRKNFLG